MPSYKKSDKPDRSYRAARHFGSPPNRWTVFVFLQNREQEPSPVVNVSFANMRARNGERGMRARVPSRGSAIFIFTFLVLIIICGGRRCILHSGMFSISTGRMWNHNGFYWKGQTYNVRAQCSVPFGYGSGKCKTSRKENACHTRLFKKSAKWKRNCKGVEEAKSVFLKITELMVEYDGFLTM